MYLRASLTCQGGLSIIIIRISCSECSLLSFLFSLILCALPTWLLLAWHPCLQNCCPQHSSRPCSFSPLYLISPPFLILDDSPTLAATILATPPPSLPRPLWVSSYQLPPSPPPPLSTVFRRVLGQCRHQERERVAREAGTRLTLSQVSAETQQMTVSHSTGICDDHQQSTRLNSQPHWHWPLQTCVCSQPTICHILTCNVITTH